MPFKVVRVRDLELRTYAPSSTTSKRGRSYNGFEEGRASCRLCPSCFLPVVVAFILIFSVSQLVIIYRTIGAYKLRNQAYEDCFSTGAIKGSSSIPNNLLLPNSAAAAAEAEQDSADLSQSFSPVWPNSSLEWRQRDKPGTHQTHYPYQLLSSSNQPIHHMWNSICPPISPLLQGNISRDPPDEEISLEEIMEKNPSVENGGKWVPPDCNPRFRLAIIIPYRDRWNHLKTLLSVLHPMLQRQQSSYQIFLVEQFGNYTFNKGILMNAGFLMAMNLSLFDCVIFHDVDLIPEDDRNIYSCESQPRHLSVAINTLAYKLPYSSLVGGVFSLRIQDFLKVNGYSNLYWGWGGEDDDIFQRLMANKMLISRPSKGVARYRMLAHERRLPNKFINPLIRTAKLRFKTDGLTTCRFRLVFARLESLFTHFLVDIGQPSLNYFRQQHKSYAVPTPPNSISSSEHLSQEDLEMVVGITEESSSGGGGNESNEGLLGFSQ